MQIRKEKTYVVRILKVKAQYFREMSAGELNEKLTELEKHLFELRAQAVTEKLENSKSILNTRRDIARIKTIISEKSK